MATLTTAQKLLIQRYIENKATSSGSSVRWVKAALNAAAQAVENELTTIQPIVASAMNVATSPYGLTLNATEKKWLGGLVMYVKYVKDVVED